MNGPNKELYYRTPAPIVRPGSLDFLTKPSRVGDQLIPYKPPTLGLVASQAKEKIF